MLTKEERVKRLVLLLPLVVKILDEERRNKLAAAKLKPTPAA